MKTIHSVSLALAIAAGLTFPALAAAGQLASIQVTNRNDYTAVFTAFKGPVSALQISAEKSDIRCVAVTATYANGRTQKVFSGNLPANSIKSLNLLGTDVAELEITCHALDATSGVIGISTNS